MPLKETPAAFLPPHLAELRTKIEASAPPFSTRCSFPKIAERLGITLKPRTMAKWSLPVQIVNGKATFPTAAALDIVFGQLASAPVIRGGRRTASDRQAA
jgi:hypothetical protein